MGASMSSRSAWVYCGPAASSGAAGGCGRAAIAAAMDNAAPMRASHFMCIMLLAWR